MRVRGPEIEIPTVIGSLLKPMGAGYFTVGQLLMMMALILRHELMLSNGEHSLYDL